LVRTIARVRDSQYDIVRAVKSKVFRWAGRKLCLGNKKRV